MYYYILEQAKNKTIESLQNKIITAIEDFQIMGEAVKANPVQKPEDLCEIGLSKGYNTVVGIGSDSLINNIAPLIAKKGAVLGIVPTETYSSFYNLIGCHNWLEATQALPKRITETIDLGLINKDKIFLTHINIRSTKSKKPVLFKAIFESFEAEVPIAEVMVANSFLDFKKGIWNDKGFIDGLISIHFKTESSQKPKGFWANLLGKKEIEYSSVFHQKTAYLGGLEQSLEVFASDDSFICNTPITVSSLSKAIKIIVAKKITKE